MEAARTPRTSRASPSSTGPTTRETSASRQDGGRVALVPSAASGWLGWCWERWKIGDLRWQAVICLPSRFIYSCSHLLLLGCVAPRGQIYRELSKLGEKISIIFVEVLASEPLVSVRLLCYRHAPPSAVREHLPSSGPGVCECFEDAAFFSTPSPLPLLITNHLPPILPCAPRLFRRRTWIPRTRRGRGRC